MSSCSYSINKNCPPIGYYNFIHKNLTYWINTLCRIFASTLGFSACISILIIWRSYLDYVLCGHFYLIDWVMVELYVVVVVSTNSILRRCY